ncbi:Co2+/Mg2+ efflux protein ApaG [Neolewinella aurantiaca]|uniref:Co2+/Mg2+ efflux protein ApaG n=1 Tax=Neolewinella aurantiaca TaxID=2602767 RepID=A0A5C7FHN1_9BACT|nr:Co2+/Mg2+ efflux protein ApaG [Neolewinella aurantiaca]TXF90617.1 Co2+/Mg2+ efflux protein ApaG [Neolewinella aurantiaca]
MVSLTTQDIRVSAESMYQRQYSVPAKRQYVYAYRIRIGNEGNVPVQLLSRTWEVIDGTGARRLVEGEGVVGRQPVIMPGQFHEYTSWVQFETPIGAMKGNYVMQRTGQFKEGEFFEVKVPKFVHVAPELLN